MKLVILSVLLISIIGIDAFDKAKYCKCRIRPRARIIDGKETLLENYPWHARIVVKNVDGKNLNACSATILNENTLLTAATCVNTPKPALSQFKVVIKDNEEVFEIEKVTKHPHFSIVDTFKTLNDVAVVTLDRNLTFSRLVQPGCLNLERRIPYYGLPLRAAGFGVRRTLVIPPKSLKDKDLISEKFSETEMFDQSAKLCPGEGDSALCTVGRNYRNLCLGDSGTAILANFKGSAEVVGVAGVPIIRQFNETHFDVCSTGNRGVRVSAYRSFIESEIADNYCFQD